jgi:hypothetical protein
LPSISSARHAVGVSTPSAGGGQPDEHLPGGGLLRGCEFVVDTLCAVGDGAFDAAGPFVIRRR